MITTDCLIIGTGPAGLTAAIYTSRANLNPIVLEGNQPGGQLTTTTEVENFPGFPEGISGPELMNRMKEQAQKFGAKFIAESAIKADLSKKPFEIKTASETIIANSIIISTGASAKYLGLPHEQELIGRGVSACATCDGFFYRNKTVFVVGGGDTAMEEATFLTKFAKEVYLVHRRDEFKASKPMQERVKKNPKIKLILNSTVSELIYDNSGLTSVVIKNLLTNKEEKHSTDGLFMAIGHTPNTKFLENQIELDAAGFIKTKNHGETNVAGVFACGDVQDPHFRQAISAAGSGCMAAILAERYVTSCS